VDRPPPLRVELPPPDKVDIPPPLRVERPPPLKELRFLGQVFNPAIFGRVIAIMLSVEFIWYFNIQNSRAFLA